MWRRFQWLSEGGAGFSSSKIQNQRAMTLIFWDILTFYRKFGPAARDEDEIDDAIHFERPPLVPPPL